MRQNRVAFDPCQNASLCETIHMKNGKTWNEQTCQQNTFNVFCWHVFFFFFHANQTHFTRRLVLKQRYRVAWKWPIVFLTKSNSSTLLNGTLLIFFSKLIRIHSFLLKPALNGSIGTMIQAANISEKPNWSPVKHVEGLVVSHSWTAHFVSCLYTCSYIFHSSRLSLEF